MILNEMKLEQNAPMKARFVTEAFAADCCLRWQAAMHTCFAACVPAMVPKVGMSEGTVTSLTADHRRREKRVSAFIGPAQSLTAVHRLCAARLYRLVLEKGRTGADLSRSLRGGRTDSRDR
jgi:hypothetical protein